MVEQFLEAADSPDELAAPNSCRDFCEQLCLFFHAVFHLVNLRLEFRSGRSDFVSDHLRRHLVLVCFFVDAADKLTKFCILRKIIV